MNAISRIVRMMQQRASINRQLWKWGGLAAWSHVHISNEKAIFIHFQMHCSHFGKRHTIHYHRSSWHICQSHLAITQSRWYSSTSVWVWDTACLFVAKRELLHPYDRSSGAPENPGNTFLTDLALHKRQSHFAIKSDLVIFSTYVKLKDADLLIRGKAAGFTVTSLRFCHTSDPHRRELEAETRLGYCWLRCCFCGRGVPGQWLKIIHN
jgi:hypothetical protein